MSEEQAIYCIKANSENYSEICEECSLYNKGIFHCYELANDIAINAIEKQIAKKASIDSYCGFIDYECPNCGQDVNNIKYCSNCGQHVKNNNK